MWALWIGDKMIEYLLNNANKFDIDVIDDREHHKRIEFHFKKIAVVINDDCYFYRVNTLIYFTGIDEIDLTIDDEYQIGHIQNIESISEIIDLTNFKTIYKRW